MPTRRNHPADPTRAIALVRVSTEKQDLSPAAQVRAINAFAKNHGITVAKVYEEIGVSGGAAIEDRPVLLEAVDAVRTHNAGILLVAKRDRLARDVVAAGLITRLVERNGGVVRTADGIGNGEDAESKLLAGIVDLFAQYLMMAHKFTSPDDGEPIDVLGIRFGSSKTKKPNMVLNLKHKDHTMGEKSADYLKLISVDTDTLVLKPSPQGWV